MCVVYVTILTLICLESLTLASGRYRDFNNIYEDSVSSDFDEWSYGPDLVRAKAMKDMKLNTVPVVKMEDHYIPPVMYELYKNMNKEQCNDNMVIKLVPRVFDLRGDQCFLDFEMPSESSLGFKIKNIVKSELRMVFTETVSQVLDVHLQFEDLFNFPNDPKDLSPSGPVLNGSNSNDNSIQTTEMTWNVTEIAQYSYRKRERMVFVASFNYPVDIEPLPVVKYVYLMLYLKTKMECKPRDSYYQVLEIKGFGRRRAAKRKNKETNETEQLCRRKGMHVDFEEIGWHTWIVSPPGYKAFYCEGKCPFTDTGHLNGSNHAIIQSLMNSHRPRIPEASCAPDNLSSITMLYFDHDNNLVLRQYSDMVVESCGCK